MPITRRACARKKSDNYDEENDKENIQDRKSSIRESKMKAMRKFEGTSDDSNGSISTPKKPLDTFDLLYSSPMKQEVNFKPLSFWSKKVKDLESKENVKKKKCELYELSETDESNSSQGSNLGKKPKKKGRTTVGRQRKKKTVKKACYDFHTKNVMKKPVVKSNNNINKECSIIRERIIMRRLNEKFTDVEDKFSLKKVTALGLTSTPENSGKLNMVGASTFDFLSPIQIPDAVPKIKYESNSDTESKSCKTEGNLPDSGENATPKRLRQSRNSKNVTKNVKRVSGSGHPTGDYLKNSFTELDSFTEKLYLSESINQNNFGSIENSDSNIESLPLNLDDAILVVSSLGNSQDEVEVSFFHFDVNEDELNEEIFEEMEGDEYPNGEYINDSCVKTHDQIIKTLLSLENVFTYCDTNVTIVSCCDERSKSFPKLPLLSASLPVGENKTELRSPTNFGFDEDFPPVEDESTGDGCSNSNTLNSCRRNSFSNVTVRRYNNVFLNFRRSTNEGGFELTHDVNNINNELLGDSWTCSDFINNGNLRTSQFINNSFCCNVSDVCDSVDGDETVVGRLTLNQVGSNHQQTHENPPAEVANNSKTGSNQYRSNETSVNEVAEQLQMYSDSGNDSSVFISSPETPNTVENINPPLRKTTDGKESEEERSGDDAVTKPGPQSSPEEQDVTSFQVGSRPKCCEGAETNVDSSTCSIFPVKSAFQEHRISDITLNDEFDFPLPIFESTTCPTPVRRKCNGGKNLVCETTQNAVEKTCRIPTKSIGEQMSCISSCRLKPGKKWARSALILKKSLNGTLLFNETAPMKKRGKMYQTFVEEVLSMQNDSQDESYNSTFLSMTAIANKMSSLTLTMRGPIAKRTVKVLKEASDDEEMNCSFRSIFMNSTVVGGIPNDDGQDLIVREVNQISARSHVLMLCQQEAPLPFEEYFNEKTLKNCKKIGEGTFGEVFMCNSNRVIKIMPIEGPDEVNGERQKKFDEILSEMVIALELSNLRNTDKYRTNGFCELKKCWCVQGKYPSHLIDLWNDFDSIGRGSENDSPVMFSSDQLYIVLEFGNGGKDLEAFVFTSSEQTLSLLFQVAYSLAVAERLLEFEHRDMHWGNILIAPTREKYFKVTLNDEVFKIPTKGVKVTIIDFTLSRVSYDGCAIYNDLSVDPTLFTSEGDYQFEIYRMMKREVMNDWSLFRPKTNIFWLHYVADKMVKMVRYKKTDTKLHKVGLIKLDEIKSKLLKFSDSEDFVLNCDFDLS